MRSRTVAAVFFLLLLPGAAYGQHSLGMHNHSGPGSDSACSDERYQGPILLYPREQAGDLSHKVSTSDPKAQQFFNQGLTFFYGFDAESALRSFYQASLADPKLAMAHWGLALAAGGDLNIPIDDPCLSFAVEHIEQAKKLLSYASPVERLYIEALALRYPGTSRPDLQQLGVRYMLAMKSVYNKIGSTDPDAGALYVYSLMNLRPWLWWTTSGQPSAEILEALRVLALGLGKFPGHIGLNHMKVHAQEEGPVARAGEALDAARVLVERAPVITPHLRHMPAHIFLLLGDWEGVIAANERAKAADQPWAETCGDPESVACNQLLVGHYYSHDMLFLAVGYNNLGIWGRVDELSNQLQANVDRFLDAQPGLEHYLTTRVAMRVHFGNWKELAELPPPMPMPDLEDPEFCDKLGRKPGSKYPRKLEAAMWYFGRAMGQASLERPADDALFGFQKAQGCVQSAGIGWGNNSASAILQVLRWRLLERIARMQRQKEASQTFAMLAVETEDLLNYDEPPGWYLSSRETYGAALYINAEYNGAEIVFREDLKRHPNNSRSLFGLWQTLEKRRSPEAPAAKANFERQWKGRSLPKMEDL